MLPVRSHPGVGPFIWECFEKSSSKQWPLNQEVFVQNLVLRLRGYCGLLAKQPCYFASPVLLRLLIIHTTSHRICSIHASVLFWHYAHSKMFKVWGSFACYIQQCVLCWGCTKSKWRKQYAIIIIIIIICTVYVFPSQTSVWLHHESFFVIIVVGVGVAVTPLWVSPLLSVRYLPLSTQSLKQPGHRRPSKGSRQGAEQQAAPQIDPCAPGWLAVWLTGQLILSRAAWLAGRHGDTSL